MHFYRHIFFIIALTALFGCAQEPQPQRVDGSSDTALEASLSKMRATLDPDSRRNFDVALSEIKWAHYDLSGSEGMAEGYRMSLDSLTADEIIELGERLKR